MIVGRRVIHRERVASTMEEIDRFAAAGEPEGLVVVAEEQTAGKGRAGRSWHAPPGSAILCSILLRPNVPAGRLTALPLIAGVAVAEAIESLVPVRCRLKWPNDVWIAEKKVAGVLITSRASTRGIDYVNLGIGINVNVSSDSLPDGSTCIALATGSEIDHTVILASLLSQLDAVYAEFQEVGSASGLLRWRQRAALLDEEVVVTTPVGDVEGRLTGTDSDGALLVARGNQLTRIVVGDLTRGPRRIPSEPRTCGDQIGGSRRLSPY